MIKRRFHFPTPENDNGSTSRHLCSGIRPGVLRSIAIFTLFPPDPAGLWPTAPEGISSDKMRLTDRN
jgi:hypothetical protein